ncbi:MAG: polysaccharide deacetylase family protein [Anaerolineae bacterium]|nr:polysaccharide deacetylase family protein [Anaerolineae bacterium]
MRITFILMVLFLLVFLLLPGVALGANPPPYGPDLMEHLCTPDPTYSLKEGEFLLPILLYHLVGREAQERNGRSISRFNVTATDFEAQLALLQRLGYHSVTVSEVAAALEGTTTLPERPIVLTFDDGWREQYEVAFPLLQRYGMRATFFVTTSFIGYSRFMTWEELAELRDAGMEIASHGRKHLNLADADDKEAWREIARSKGALEEKLGISVVSFAYPYGAYRKGLPAMLERAGYRIAVGVGGTPVHRFGGRYYLRRMEVSGFHSLRAFVDRLPWRGAGSPLCASEMGSGGRVSLIPAILP